ncbi:MAG TPA: HAMP domain-containing sensor histidine kinase [Polyangiaceae bacterium]
MASTTKRQGIGYRRSVQLLVYLVIVPMVLLLTLGIVTMIIGQAGFDLLLGILMVCFVAAVTTGVILVLVFIRREANLSELQADFVSKVSHELRTPLTAIRLFAETLERSKGDAKTSDECVKMLSSETEKLSRRIQRLLDWGRMEAGRKLYDLHPTSPMEIVKSATDAFSPLRTDDKLVFEAQVDDDLPDVAVDRDAVTDALVNLLSNARKYGGTPPVVSLRAYRDEKGDVAFEVTDNGQGIPRALHRRIFDKFYRIDDRLSRAREGSGLGLAIVKHIVRAHRGRIVLDSAPGKGSTFRILLAPADKLALKTSSSAPAAPSTSEA